MKAMNTSDYIQQPDHRGCVNEKWATRKTYDRTPRLTNLTAHISSGDLWETHKPIMMHNLGATKRPKKTTKSRDASRVHIYPGSSLLAFTVMT